MNKLVLFFALIFCSVSLLWGQKTKTKNVNTKYLHYPALAVDDISTYKITIHTGDITIEQNDLKEKKGLFNSLQNVSTDPEFLSNKKLTLTEINPDLHVEISYGSFNIHDTQLKDHKIVCNRGEKITKESITECPAYYYDVYYTLPVVLRIKDRQDKVVFAEKMEENGTEKFGYDPKGLSGYLKTSELKEAYAKDGAKSVLKDAFKTKLEETEKIINKAFYFFYEDDRFQVATGAGRNHDYFDLDKAQEIALNAYELIDEGKSFKEVKNQLLEAISIWKNAVEELDMGNKKARINRVIGTDLNQNLAIAYMYLRDFDNAKRYISETQKLVRHASNLNKHEEADFHEKQINERSYFNKAFQRNQSTSTSNLMEADNLMDPVRVKEKHAPYPFLVNGIEDHDSFRSDYEAFLAANKMNQPTGQQQELMANADPEKTLNSMLSGNGMGEAANNYEARVSNSATQGYFLMLMSLLDGKMDELPQDICTIDYLNELSANGLDIKIIPGEIRNMKQLNKLSLKNNQLKILPDEICELTALENLNLSGNKLIKLPDNIGQLQNLKKLNLKKNNIPAEEQKRIEKALPDCKIKF